MPIERITGFGATQFARYGSREDTRGKTANLAANHKPRLRLFIEGAAIDHRNPSPLHVVRHFLDQEAP
jgi:hypothetical protein